jgi:hypothetical protein
MGVTGLARAGLAGQDGGEGAGGGVAGFVRGGASSQALEGGLDGGEVVKGVKAVGAATELARSLGAAEHEQAQDGGLITAKIEDGTDPVLVFGDARIAYRADERHIFEGVKGLPDLLFGEIKDRVATGALVARVNQGVERERIVFGRSDLFFDEGAEDAELDGIEVHGYKGATAGVRLVE